MYIYSKYTVYIWYIYFHYLSVMLQVPDKAAVLYKQILATQYVLLSFLVLEIAMGRSDESFWPFNKYALVKQYFITSENSLFVCLIDH